MLISLTHTYSPPPLSFEKRENRVYLISLDQCNQT